MSKSNTYLVVTPFFPSNESFVGSYIFDQLNEIRKQSNLDIELVKIASLFSDEKDYFFKDFSVKVFKTIDFPYFIFPGVFNFINKRRFRSFLKKSLCNLLNLLCVIYSAKEDISLLSYTYASILCLISVPVFLKFSMFQFRSTFFSFLRIVSVSTIVFL